MDVITTATTYTAAPGFDLPDCRLCIRYTAAGCVGTAVCRLGSNFMPGVPVRFYPLQPLAGSQKA
jgi:hypothetical protein